MKPIKAHSVEITAALLGILAIHAFLFTDAFRGDHIDSAKASEFGQFIAGYLGTIFLVLSVALLSASFRSQVRSSKETAFETRFFELLKYHRENVSEIGIGERTGRRVFVSLIREFRATLEIVGPACTEVDPSYSLSKKIDLTYMVFYYGVGPNSTRVLTEAIGSHPPEMVRRVVERLESLQKECREYEKGQRKAVMTSATPMGIASLRMPRLLERISYVPFDGHQSRLGHYYRHLYQTVKYARNHAPKEKAAEYVDIIRAQLTNHEQALLCLNSLSTIGSAWIRFGYLTDYSMIKNIPKGFFNPENEVDLKAQFPKIRFEFEDMGEASKEANRDL